MYKPSYARQVNDYELLDTSDSRSSAHHRASNSQKSALGQPQQARRLWPSDYLSTVICLACFVGGLLAIFVTAIATKLGQVNQLIVIGAALQLMALCTARHVRIWLLTVECLWAGSSLQNYESIVSASFTIPDSALLIRAVILLYLITPLGLGIGYKGFTGDRALTRPWTETGFYGMIGPPGTVGLGSSGIALLINATAGWWNNPVSYGAYGFNLNVESSERTALLDGPTPELALQLQSKLPQDTYIIVKAIVNATVTDMVFDLTDQQQRPDLTYWYQNATTAAVSAQQATNDLWLKSRNNSDIETITLSPDSEANTRFSILNWPANSSFIITSRYNQTAGENFGSAAQGFHSYRQKYVGSWIVTKTSVLLDHAEPIAETVLIDNATKALIEDNYVNIANNFQMTFSEFDWKNGYADFITQDQYTVPELSIQQKYIKSDTTLVSASLWAILAIVNGPANPLYLKFQNSSTLIPMNVGLRYETQGSAQMSVQVLHRSWVLILILSVQPLILLTTLLMRLTVLRDAPISTDFGLISLLAGIDADSLSLVRGAAYSGKLKKTVRVKFLVSSGDKGYNVVDMTGSGAAARGQITATLQDSHRREHISEFSRQPRVKHGTLYG